MTDAVGDGVGIDDIADGGIDSGLVWLSIGVKFNVQLSTRKSNIKRFWMATELRMLATDICPISKKKKKKEENIRQLIILNHEKKLRMKKLKTQKSN